MRVIEADAEKLAAWVGHGKAVTPKGVLRKADVPGAAEALGVEVPAKLRTAADVRVLHWPWTFARAVGMIRIDGDRAMATQMADGDDRELWFAGLQAVLRAESPDKPHHKGAALMCRAVLDALVNDACLNHELLDVFRFGDHRDWSAARYSFPPGFDLPVDVTLRLLAEFGAIDPERQLTPLGRWAHEQFETRAPKPITPDMPVGELIACLPEIPEYDRFSEAYPWLRERGVDGVAELLQAADSASPAARMAALDTVLGFEDIEPLWKAALQFPNVAPHARFVLGAEESEGDHSWLAAEYALAALSSVGVEEAYFVARDYGGVDDSSHPDVDKLRAVLAEFVDSGGGCERIYQLKVVLKQSQPVTWRRVIIPGSAMLNLLHHVVNIAIYADGDDHLHNFTVDEMRYSDPYFDLEEHSDEHEMRIRRAFPEIGSSIAYLYDFGDHYDHKITLEKILDPADDVTYPMVTEGRGHAAFDKDAVNRRLAKLLRPADHP